ncbi:uncharacterized protein [Temnothorax nylanderi]|uniref:uncharacterized protein n=1 Tax=Temnothorax nylanderi TaxID=102681 RepID=UPI003A89724C
MFLIHCQNDNSYCKVEDFEVCYDEENIPNPGELVKFYWQNSKYDGTVIMQSDDDKIIDKKLRELNKSTKSKSTSSTTSTIITNEVSEAKKRIPIAKRTWSPATKENNVDNTSQTKKKKNVRGQGSKPGAKDVSQDLIESSIVFPKGDKLPKSKKPIKQKSPSKDDLKKQLETMKF